MSVLPRSQQSDSRVAVPFCGSWPAAARPSLRSAVAAPPWLLPAAHRAPLRCQWKRGCRLVLCPKKSPIAQVGAAGTTLSDGRGNIAPSARVVLCKRPLSRQISRFPTPPGERVHPLLPLAPHRGAQEDVPMTASMRSCSSSCTARFLSSLRCSARARFSSSVRLRRSECTRSAESGGMQHGERGGTEWDNRLLTAVLLHVSWLSRDGRRCPGRARGGEKSGRRRTSPGP